MLAYGAIVHTDERSITYEKLLATRKSYLLKPGKILTAIEIPLESKGAYHKHTKHKNEVLYYDFMKKIRRLYYADTYNFYHR